MPASCPGFPHGRLGYGLNVCHRLLLWFIVFLNQVDNHLLRKVGAEMDLIALSGNCQTLQERLCLRIWYRGGRILEQT